MTVATFSPRTLTLQYQETQGENQVFTYTINLGDSKQADDTVTIVRSGDGQNYAVSILQTTRTGKRMVGSGLLNGSTAKKYIDSESPEKSFQLMKLHSTVLSLYSLPSSDSLYEMGLSKIAFDPADVGAQHMTLILSRPIGISPDN